MKKTYIKPILEICLVDITEGIAANSLNFDNNNTGTQVLNTTETAQENVVFGKENSGWDTWEN